MAKKKEKICKWGLVCGVLSLIIFPIIFGIVAIILGAIGRDRGEKYSEASIILGVLGIVLGILVAVYVPFVLF